MNFYNVNILAQPGLPVQQVTVAASSFEVIGDVAIFSEKREVVAAIKNFLTITKFIPEEKASEQID